MEHEDDRFENACSNDGCNMTTNKRNKVNHETELCGFKKVKCHNCVELKNEVAEMKDQFAAKMHQMEQKITSQASQMEERIMKEVTSGLNEIKSSKVQELASHSRADIIVAGGEIDYCNFVDSVETFSWSTKSWARSGAMKRPRSEACAVVYGSQMIVTGGYTDGAGDSDTMEMMDIKLGGPGKWKMFPAKLPIESYGHNGVCYKDRLIVIGGRDYDTGKKADTIHEVLLVPPYCKKLLARLPQKISDHGVELLNDKIFIFGGENDDSDRLDSVVRFDVSGKKCQQMAPLPFVVSEMATVIWGNKVIVIGGKNLDSEVLDSVVMYDVTTGESKMLPSMKYKRYACTAVITGDVVVVMGGYDKKEHCLNLVECFNLGRQAWEELPHMIEPRAYATAVVKK